MIDRHHGWNVSLKPLFLGVIFSLILILAAYRIVTYYHLSNLVLIVTIFSLGIVQALIQLVFFLHLGLENKPYLNVVTFLFMVLVIIVVIGGSLWIMYNLNYNLMPKTF
jgi:cytochrome o ubiquinol oxidase subunit IV